MLLGDDPRASRYGRMMWRRGLWNGVLIGWCAALIFIAVWRLA
jgi:hypothetical protein